jgi:serine/alanine adding enzyme
LKYGPGYGEHKFDMIPIGAVEGPYHVSVCESPGAWDAFTGVRSEHIYYRWEWQRVVSSTFGHAHHYLQAVNSDNNVVGVLPLFELKSALFGHYALSLPFVNYGGIIADDDSARDSLLSHCEKLGARKNLSHILLRESKESRTPWHCEQHKITMLMDLPENPELLWKDLGSKRRAQIKRPGKEGAYAKIGRLELLNDFYRVFTRNMRDLGTPVYGISWFRNILEAFPVETHLVIVYLNDLPVAAAFLIRHGSQMEIPWASSLREANRFGVNMLLYWEVLKFSIEQGAQRFDFGRSSKDANTYRFKKQWGSEPHQLFWYNWTPAGKEVPKLNPQNSKYAKVIEVWKKLPLPVANILGPIIVKYLP